MDFKKVLKGLFGFLLVAGIFALMSIFSEMSGLSWVVGIALIVGLWFWSRKDEPAFSRGVLIGTIGILIPFVITAIYYLVLLYLYSIKIIG